MKREKNKGERKGIGEEEWMAADLEKQEEDKREEK